MKKFRSAFGLIALVTLVLSTSHSAGVARTRQELSRTELSLTCNQYCRDVCIANGDPCCFVGSGLCACC